jgi:solute carrier family 25 iron transporter 28/37
MSTSENTLLQEASPASTAADTPVNMNDHIRDSGNNSDNNDNNIDNSSPEALPDDDWEEWDGQSPFWVHCVAGSLAGVAEHTAVYPLDTVRTHIQVCASCLRNPAHAANVANANAANGTSGTAHGGGSLNKLHHKPQLPTGMWQTIRYLTRQQQAQATAGTAAPLTRASHAAAAASASNASASSTFSWTAIQQQLHGYTRLFRGVQTILIGCIPAHALYFSSYEIVKDAFTDGTTGKVSATGSLLAGAAAVASHDLVLTPLDTMKQRMQLGYYKDGMGQAITHILRQEGGKALYRSFPVTLATNIPYGMVMVSVNEVCKQSWHSPDVPAWQTVLVSSSVAGCLAATVTTPLDRIKTALQTQQLVPACQGSQPNCPVTTASVNANGTTNPIMNSWRHVAAHIYRTEGYRGFFRGMVPRLLSHTPAAAISWTTYESAKHYLLKHN